MFEYSLFQKAIKDKKHIVLPEASDDRILRATDILLHRKIVNITLLGDEKVIRYRAKVLGLDISVANIINPKTSTLTQKLANSFFNLRKHKGITKEFAYDMIIEDKNYFATMMIKENLADGMVSGSSSTTANTVRPALQIIKTKPNIDIVSSAFFMCMDTKVLVFADCAINQSPNVKDLANIAISSAMTAKDFGIDAKIAMLSYSTGNSSSSNEVQKVQDAVELIKKLEPSLNVVGPIQYDAAINKTIAKKKLLNSTIMGDATILIFPDLNTGNNTYKAVQNSGNTIAIGPVLQGLNGAINDLSRGATVADIVNTVALTAIQAQGLR
jgi:phosphate acetyltransferase